MAIGRPAPLVDHQLTAPPAAAPSGEAVGGQHAANVRLVHIERSLSETPLAADGRVVYRPPRESWAASIPGCRPPQRRETTRTRQSCCRGAGPRHGFAVKRLPRRLKLPAELADSPGTDGESSGRLERALARRQTAGDPAAQRGIVANQLAKSMRVIATSAGVTSCLPRRSLASNSLPH